MDVNGPRRRSTHRAGECTASRLGYNTLPYAHYIRVGANGTNGAGGTGGTVPPGRESTPTTTTTTITTDMWPEIPETAYRICLLLTALLAILAAIGVAVATGVLAHNIHKLYAQNQEMNQLINQLELQLQLINASLPDGNGTTVFDNEWTIAHGPNPGRKFMWNAGNITAGVKQTYYLPDTSGVVALQSTLPTTFPENLFAITGINDTRSVTFSLELFTPGITRVFQYPNKNGILATLDDIVAASGNTSEFLDSAFAILGDPDTTRRVMFNNGMLQTASNYTFFFPDVLGGAILVVTTGNQTLSDKTLDNTNIIMILDVNFAIENALGNQAFFNATALTSNHVYTLPDADMTFVGRNDTDWEILSIGMDGGSGSFNFLNLMATTGVDRFFKFRSGGGGGGNNGYSGIYLSSSDTDNWFLTADANDGGDFKLFWNSSVPMGNNELGDVILSVDDSNKRLRLHQSGDDTVYMELSVSSLTVPRIGTFRDRNCLFVCSMGPQTLSLTVLDDTNTITVNDTELTIKGAGGRKLKFDGSNMQDDITLVPPIANGTMALDWNDDAVICVALSGGSDQTLSTGVATKINFVESIDANGNFASGTYTAPRTGLYRIFSAITFEGGLSVGVRRIILNHSGTEYLLQTLPAISTLDMGVGGSILLAANATDTFEIFGFQTAGVSLDVLNLVGSLVANRFSVEFVGFNSQIP